MHSKGDLRKGLALARVKVVPKYIPEIVAELARNPTYRAAFAVSTFPRSFHNFTHRRRLGGADAHREIVWHASVLKLFSSELTSFVRRKLAFDAAYISGEYETAQECLDEIEDEFGVSIWLMACRIQLIQLKDGLTAQKAFLQDTIYSDDTNDLLAFLAYFLSLRAEENVSLAALLHEIRDLLELKGFKDLVRHHVCPYALVDSIKVPADVAHMEEASTVIDRYLALVLTLQLEYVRAPESRGVIQLALNILADISDLRLSRISGCHHEDELHEHLSLCDLYTSGDYSSVSYSIRNTLNNSPSRHHLFELCARAEAFCGPPDGTPDGSIADRIIRNMTQVILAADVGQKALLDLRKLAVVCLDQDLSTRISSFCENYLSDPSYGSHASLQVCAAMISPYEDPWAASFLDHAGLDVSRLENLISANPKSTSLKLQDVLRMPFEAGSDALEVLDIPIGRRFMYKGHLAMKYGLYDQAVGLYGKVLEIGEPYAKVVARRNLFKALFEVGEIDACCQLVSEHFVENNESHRIYPMQNLLERVDEVDSATLPAAIVLYIGARHYDPKYERDLSDAYEDYLDRRGVGTPTELIGLYGDELPLDVEFFLKNICTPRILDDSVAFATLNDVEQERIAICQALISFDPDSAVQHSAEIRALTRDAEVARLVRVVEEGKIYVDEEGIRNALQPSLNDSFERYRKLLSVPAPTYQADKISKRLGELLGDALLHEPKIRLPSDERQSLFGTMLTAFSNQFALNPAYGLDTHLSTNVRHGAFEGHLRGPIASHELLNSRKVNTYNYDNNEYWMERYQHFSHPDQHEVNRLLERFSKRVDEQIDEFKKNLLHVRTNTAAAGLFDFRKKPEQMQEIMEEIRETTTYDEFFQILNSAAWESVDQSLQNIKSELRGVLGQQINQAYLGLITELERKFGRDRVSALVDAVVQSRTEFQVALERVCSWFQRSSSRIAEPLPFDLIADVAIKQIENCHTIRLKGAISTTINVPFRVDGAHLDGLVDVLFILLQNSIIHGGYSKSPPCLALSIAVENDLLSITLRNEIASGIDLQERRMQAADAVSRYKHDTAMKMARQEGGSGLSKVWRILEYDLKVDHMISLDISDDRLIEVTALMSTKEIMACEHI